MTDATQVKDSVAESERRLAQHEYVSDAGEAVSIETAVGNRYKSKSGFERVWTRAELGDKAWDMLANFGARTLMINTTSGARQRDESEEEALDSRAEQLANGDWRERGEGAVRGPKYDRAILAQAVFELLTADGKAKGDAAYYLAKLTDEKDGKGYAAKIRSIPQIMVRYNELAPKSEASLDSIA